MLHDIFHNIVALTSFYRFLFRPPIDITLSSLLFSREKKGGIRLCSHHPPPHGTLSLGLFGKLMGTTCAYQGVQLLPWVPPVHSKVYRYLTSLPCFLHFEVQVSIQYFNPQPLSTWFKVMGLFESCITYHLNNYEFFMTLFVTLNLLIKNL